VRSDARKAGCYVCPYCTGAWCKGTSLCRRTDPAAAVLYYWKAVLLVPLVCVCQDLVGGLAVKVSTAQTCNLPELETGFLEARPTEHLLHSLLQPLWSDVREILYW